MFLNLSEIELVKFFRSEKNSNVRNQILKSLLFRKGPNGTSWHQKICSHIRNYCTSRIFKYNNRVNENDLYEEVMKKTVDVLDRHFDLNTQYGFATYYWHVIRTSIERVFQDLDKAYEHEKRSVSLSDPYDETKAFCDVISTENVGCHYQTAKKTSNFEKIFFYRQIIDFIRNALQPIEFEASTLLKHELTNLKFGKKTNIVVLKALAEQHNLPISEIIRIKDIIQGNLEKELFSDILKFLETGTRDDSALAKKYNHSRAHITKMKKKFGKFVKNELTKINVSIGDIFEGDS